METTFANGRAPKGLLSIVLGVLIVVASAAPVAAQRVRDEGQFFSPDTVARVESQLNDLQRQSGRQVIVETYAEAPAAIGPSVDLADRSIRAKAFEQFGQARAKQIGADVYVLVNRSPSHLRVVERNDLQKEVLPAADRDRVAQAMLSAFGNKQYDQGLTNGVAAIGQALMTTQRGGATPAAAGDARPGAPAAAPGSSSRDFEPKGSSPTATKSNGGGGGFGMGTWLLLIVGGFILFRIVKGFLNRGQRGQQNNPYARGGFGGAAGNPQQQQGPYNQQGGYGQQAPGGFGGGGGGFGRGMMGGVLGGVLGSVLGSRIGHGQSQPTDPSATGGGRTDPANTNSDPGYSSSGGDFDSGGGGDSGGGDSSGGDF
jgi:uncharacterized membrane protein YgcG